MMKHMFMIFVIFFSVCCNTTRNNQSKIQDREEGVVQSLVKCLEDSIHEVNVRSCPNYDSKNLLEYYREEISKFSLDQALAEINQWSDRLHLEKGKDTIALIFFYPAVGFDPEQGYITEYCIYGGSLNKGVIGESNKNATPFKVSRLPQSEIRKKLRAYQNYKSGCESGMLAITYLSPDLEPNGCYIAVGITAFN